jgi:hypothetical protein
MNMNKNLDSICMCGHLKSKHKALCIESHQVDRMGKYIYYCSSTNGFFNPVRCYCNNFKLDNLRYLEQLYESRSSR